MTGRDSTGLNWEYLLNYIYINGICMTPLDPTKARRLGWDYLMNYVYFTIFYLLTLPILGQKLVDSADSTGLVWTRLDSPGLDWDYLMNYIYINLFYFQTQLDSNHSAGLLWTRLDSSRII